jgi:hypothetical protein
MEGWRGIVDYSRFFGFSSDSDMYSSSLSAASAECGVVYRPAEMPSAEDSSPRNPPRGLNKGKCRGWLFAQDNNSGMTPEARRRQPADFHAR